MNEILKVKVHIMIVKPAVTNYLETVALTKRQEAEFHWE